jgi:hypothetical protein
MLPVSKLLSKYNKVTFVKLYVNSLHDKYNLNNVYLDAVKTHNKKILKQETDDIYSFELFSPKKMHTAMCETPLKIDYNIICSATSIYGLDKIQPSCVFLIPSQNISNTRLRVTNPIQIIGPFYRGHIESMFDALENTEVNKYDKYMKLCSPDTSPMILKVVDTLDELDKFEITPFEG